MSGLIAECDGTVYITKCASDVKITYTGTNSTYSRCAGLAGEVDGTVYITNSVFTGSFLSPDGKGGNNGGFVYNYDTDSKIYLTSCLFAPEEITIGTYSCDTFCCTGYSPSVLKMENCFYTQPFGYTRPEAVQVYRSVSDIPDNVMYAYYEDYGVYLPHTLSALVIKDSSENTRIDYKVTSFFGSELIEGTDYTAVISENGTVTATAAAGSSNAGSVSITVESQNSFNMPVSGTLTVDLSHFTGITGTAFKVYDDGGPNSSYSRYSVGYILFIAPEGCKLKLEGEIRTDYGDYLNAWDGTSTGDTLLLDKIYGYNGRSWSRDPKTITTVTTVSNALLINFESDSYDNYEGLDLTVTVIE